MQKITFQPPIYLKNPYVQSILASKRPGGKLSPLIKEVSQNIIIQCKNNVRLMGTLSKQQAETSKPFIILLHGWEGSGASRYAIGTTNYLFQNGFNVFRLNLRDHGDTHHLNKGLFFISFFDEVFDAVSQIAQMANGNPVCIVGFSLGGNFALRIARQQSITPIVGLKHILAISPPVNPELTTKYIDEIPLFKYYFLKKWKRSLQKKQDLFPNLFNFDDVLRLASIRDVTDALVKEYSEFSNTLEYFETYTLIGNALKSINIPTTIVVAADDPIIPINDFYQFPTNPATRLIVHAFGGHLGFNTGFFSSPWFDPFMANLF